MKVEINEEKFLVRWNYRNSVVEDMCNAVGISNEEARNLTSAQLEEKLKGVMGLLKMKAIPASDICICSIEDEQGDIISVGTIQRSKKKNHNKHKARVYSLAEALTKVFSGPTYRSFRKQFWDTYLNRPRVPATLQLVDHA